MPVDGIQRGDVHGCGEGVVAALPHVDVVVRADGLLRAELPAEQLDGPVGQHLVDVHVALRARSRLPHEQWEVLVEFAGDRLFRGLHDHLRQPRFQPACLLVDQRAGFLHQSVGVVDLDGHAVGAYREMLQRTLGLGAPVPIGGHVDGAEAVELLTGTGGVDTYWGHTGVLHGGLRPSLPRAVSAVQ